MKLSIVMPAYNEAPTIQAIVNRVRETPYDKEIIIVDDGSTDGTRDKLKELEKFPDVKVVYHQQNQGKVRRVAHGLWTCHRRHHPHPGCGPGI